MSELQFMVLLEPDEDDPGVYSASVSGLSGKITTVGPPQLALNTVRGALEQLVMAVGPEDAIALAESQHAVSVSDLSPGSRLERVIVRVSWTGDSVRVSA